MRLTLDEVELIRRTVLQQLGANARVMLFGSRVHDHKKGGDVDLFIEMPEPIAQPALVGATISAHITLGMHGRDVDVVLCAPNLMAQPIHEVARQTGVWL